MSRYTAFTLFQALLPADSQWAEDPLAYPKSSLLQGSQKGTPTWTLKVCRIMAFMAVIMGLGLLFYILLGLR